MALDRVFARRLPYLALGLLVLAGCSSTGRKAPVEDRSTVARPAAAASAPAVEAATPPLPGAENAGKPGYYTVKPGDTLIRIALDSGQNWRDVARWNNIDNPNVVEAGQVLRVLPPAADATAVTARPVPGAGRVETKPLDPKAGATGAAPVQPAVATASAPSQPAAAAAQPATSAPSAAATVSPATSAAAAAPAASVAAEDVVWAWPAAGAVIAGFDEGRNRGLTIAGKAGDPVLAAGDGRVIYAGSSLRGYGNLVIVKHNELYLTAYAHNQTLLVKDDQPVRRGQKIAEMGSTDAERVQLHFEIRRQGKPIDPAKLLPAR
jgi:lipoprotein NlpD